MPAWLEVIAEESFVVLLLAGASTASAQNLTEAKARYHRDRFAPRLAVFFAFLPRVVIRGGLAMMAPSGNASQQAITFTVNERNGIG